LNSSRELFVQLELSHENIELKPNYENIKPSQTRAALVEHVIENPTQLFERLENEEANAQFIFLFILFPF
jgi:hypothetical protein